MSLFLSTLTIRGRPIIVTPKGTTTWRSDHTSRGPLTTLTLVKGVINYIVRLIIQFRTLITLFMTKV